MATCWNFSVGGAVILASALFAPGGAWAQQGEGSATSVAAPRTTIASPPLTAPLEERISAARSVKVVTSILGIKLGSELDKAHEKLDKRCAPGTRPKEAGGEEEEKEAGEKRGRANEEQPKPTPSGGEEQEEGHKVLWQLAGTDYSALYITADEQEHIDSITGFLRPEKQLPFGAVGELSKAPVKDDNSVVWDVLRPNQPLFRVVAKGSNGKASSIRLFVVKRKSGAPIPSKIKKDDR